MYVLCTYLNLHHDFVEFNTQSSCFKYPLSCISWQFFQKAPTFHDPASTDRSRILTPPRDRGTREEGQVQRYNSWRAVLQMPSMKWWCTWLPCCLFFTVLEPPCFKSYSINAIYVFIPGGSWQWLLKDFFLALPLLIKQLKTISQPGSSPQKKCKISKPQSNLGLDLFLLTSMCWSMTVAVIVQENSPHKSYLCLKAHL